MAGSFPVGFVSERDLSGYLGGLHAGYDVQFGKFVVGAVGEHSWSNISGDSCSNSPIVIGRVNCGETDLKRISSLAARIGYTLQPNWLVYLKAGVAWAKFEGAGTLFNVNGTPRNLITNEGTSRGWLIGAGSEWAFARHWSLKVEYDYVDFGSNTSTPTNTQIANNVGVPLAVPITVLNPTENERDLHQFKLGISYRF